MSAKSIKLVNTDHDLPQISGKRDLFPRWLLVLIFLFLVFGAIVPVWIIMGFFKSKFHITLLGISTHNPLSLICITSFLFYLSKAVTAYALWTEKDWAIKIAKVDAVFSILLCCFEIGHSFMVPAYNGSQLINSAISLLISILYLIKMSRIQLAWENFDKHDLVN